MAVTSTNELKIPVTDVELAFRAKRYQDIKDVHKKEIACATCNADLNASLQKSQNIFVHPILETLQCKKCSTYYGDGEFSLDEDGTDKYCRFCGNGGNLYICGNSDCPYGFCKNCATKKVGQSLNKLEADDWQCLCCDPKPLWKLRAICATVITHCSKNQRKPGKNRSSGSVRFQLAQDDNPVESSDNDIERSDSIRNFRTKLDRQLKKKKLHEKFEKLKKISALCDDEETSPKIPKPFYDEKSSSSADEAARLNNKPRLRAQKSDTKQQEDGKTIRERNKTNSDSKNSKQNVPSKGSKAKNQKVPPIEDSESDEKSLNVQSNSKNEKTTPGIKAKRSRDGSSKSNSDIDSNSSTRPHKKVSKINPKKTTLAKTKNSLKNINSSSNSNSEDESDSLENERQKNLPQRKRKKKNIGNESKSSSQKMEKSRNSDSDEESDSAKSKISKQENENKVAKISIVSETIVDKKHRFSLLTEKPQVTKSRRLFSLDNEPEGLEEKQSESLKPTNSKLSKSKEYVTKQQAKVIRKHVLQVVNQMKTLGSALSFSADKLTEKYLRNNMTRIDVATKAIHKSRLLMNRSMKKLRQVDKEFTSSCAFWGKDSKVPSIATVLEPFASDTDEIADLDISMPITDKDENLTGDSHALEHSSLLDLENPASNSTLADVSSISTNPATAKSSAEESMKESNNKEEDPELRNSDEEMEESPTDSQTKTVSEDTEQTEAAGSNLSSKKKRLSNDEMNNNSDTESETLHDSRKALDSANLSIDEKDSASENSSKNVTTDQSLVKATANCDDMLSENDEAVATNGTTSKHLVEEPIVSTDKQKSDKEHRAKMRLRRKTSSDHDAADVQESTDSFDLVDRSPIDSVTEPDQNNKQEIENSKSVKNQDTECNEVRPAVDRETEPDEKDTASNNNETNGLDGKVDLEKSDCENHESPPQGIEHSNDDRTTRHSTESSDSNKSSSRKSKNKRSKLNKDVSPASSSKDVVSNVASDEEPTAENDTCQSSDHELFENSNEMENECIANSQVDINSSNKKLSAQDDDETIASDLEMTLDPEKTEKKSVTPEKQKKGSSGEDLIDREGDETGNVIMSSSNSEADNLEKCDVQWKDSETDSDEKLLRDIRSDIESANARQLEAAEDEAMKDPNITVDSLESEEDLKTKMLEHESDLSDISEECAVPNEVEPDNSEDERERKMLESDTELSDIIETLSPAASPDNSDAKIPSDCDIDLSDHSGNKSQTRRNSEDELKRKILESDSDEPEDDGSKSESNKDPAVEILQKILESDTDTSDIVAPSQKKDSGRKEDKESTSISKSPDENKTSSKTVNNVKRSSSISSKSTDAEDTELNAIAKKQLLSSSDDSDISDLGTPRIKVCSFANEFGNVGVDDMDTVKSGNSETPRSKRKKFNIKKNSHYANDKKLQMICQVVVRRLNEKVLDQFANVLDKSKQRQAHKSFQSLVDLKSLKARKKKDASSATSDSDNRSSSPNPSVTKTPKKKKTNATEEKEDTLMDHLEKIQNGENTENSTDDQLDESTNTTKDALTAKSHDVFVKKANEVAKDLLMNSSDSEVDNQSVPDNEEEEDEKSNEKPTKKSRKKNEKKSDSKKKQKNGGGENVSDDEVKEDEEKSTNEKDSDSEATRRRKRMQRKLDKRNWKISDSDTSDDERRLENSQKKQKSAEQSDADAEMPLEVTRKRTNKGKRRVLNSDSDSPKLTDSEENEKETVKKKKSDSDNSEEIFDRLKKKKRKRKQKDSSDSDSSPEEKSKKTKRKRIKKIASDSDSENQDSSQESPGKSHRKNIRKVLKDKQVADQTKMAGKEEEERLKRIAERQKLYNEMYEMKLAGEEKVEKLILDFDEETKKELITVHPELVKRLKPHQARGIKFMWDACFESLEQIKSTKGSGCILAHCMGLGKTFQVVTLSHTLLAHPETGVKTIMVVCPLSTVLNWVNEFKSWLRNVNDGDDVEVFEMTKLKKNFERKYALQSWQKSGGVMIIGYEMFRILSNSTGKKMRKNMLESILKCLVDPGPDLIICDEGHLLKNEDTALSKAMKRVKTLRRVVLTGTPLQNNLTEYHCMVQFVKPNLLGTKKEFLNRFVNPITNGQFDDSTEYDVKLMKKRAHVLHKMLEGSVQRFDYSVLTPFLPPKQEYVISVRLSEIQIQLYQYYIDNLSRHKVGVGGSLFADFQALQRIWTHPVVLRMNAEKMEKKKRIEDSDSEGSLKDFLDDGSTESTSSDADSDVQSVHDSNEEKTTKSQRRTRGNPIDDEEEEPVKQEETESTEWWSQYVKPEHFEDLRISAKLVLLFAILKESEQLGDKVLVFSQSLYALTLIEDFLEKIDESTQKGGENELLENHTGSWYLGLDYFRLDGQTAPENRNQYCKIFNNPKNTRARLFLISTRAGGLGINLTAANRVIIFDASWNPSHDVQSIFRIYRFGQKKPCYVYRFLAHGTMEEKIYNRQVTKLSLSCRVVDEQQIERHYSNHDLAELYQFEPNTSTEKPTLALPRDRLLAEIFLKYKDYIETYHEHDSLLENKAEEELDEEERKEAWKEYEEERKGLRMNMNNMPNQNMLLQQYAMANPNFAHNQADIANRAALSGFNFDTLQALIQKDYPNATPEQQKMMTTRAVLDMYNYMENQVVRQHQPMISTPTNNFNYPTMNNIGPASFTDNNAALQYTMQQQQRQALLQMQRKQQMNYAQRFGNVASTVHTPIQEIQIDDHDVIEMESEPRLATPSAGTATASSTATVPAVVPVLSSKRQEE